MILTLADGCQNEIYFLPTKPEFIGKSFTNLSKMLYNEYQIILFGVETFVSDLKKRHLMLNPGPTYLLRPDDICFFLANSQKDIDSYDLEERSLMLSEMSNKIELVSAEPGSPVSIINRAEVFEGFPEPPYTDCDVEKCFLYKIVGSKNEKELTRIPNDFPSHILVLASHFELFRFISVLRTVNLTKREYKPVIILHKRPPTDQEWDLISVFPDVYFIVGDLRLESDLVRSGIATAARVVIMADRPNDLAVQDDFFDTTAIMTNHRVRLMFPDDLTKFVITELINRENVKFVKPSFHSRKTLKGQSPEGYSKQFLSAPTYAAGRVIVGSILDSLIFQSFYNPYLSEIIKVMLSIRHKSLFDIDRMQKAQSSHFTQIAVPSEFIVREIYIRD